VAWNSHHHVRQGEGQEVVWCALCVPYEAQHQDEEAWCVTDEKGSWWCVVGIAVWERRLALGGMHGSTCATRRRVSSRFGRRYGVCCGVSAVSVRFCAA
jgi:hypothetical protein